jgi:hypothetical protein
MGTSWSMNARHSTHGAAMMLQDHWPRSGLDDLRRPEGAYGILFTVRHLLYLR